MREGRELTDERDAEGQPRGLLWDLLDTVRPNRWQRHLLVFVPLLFTNRLWSTGPLLRCLGAAAALCALSSCACIMDDLVDVDTDRRHPLKAGRPIVAGRLRTSHAFELMLVLLIGGLIGAESLGLDFFVVALSHIVLLFVYVFVLSAVPILDMLALAGGYVLSAVGGAVVIGLVPGKWLIVCSASLGLLLAAGRRWGDAKALSGTSMARGPAAEPVIAQIMTLAAAATAVSYLLYAAADSTVVEFGDRLLLTLPFVVYGVCRLLLLVRRSSGREPPRGWLLADWPLGLGALLWAAATAAVVSL